MEIGKQIKKYRISNNLSQEDLSDKIFVSRQTISNWENNKNYPDIKSLLLLSSTFNVSLDILVKGDLEEMREQIKREDINNLNNYSKLFTSLLLVTIFSFVPLIKFMGYIGGIIWVFLCIATIYYGFIIEKYKKNFDIQTYKEIVSFLDGKNLNKVEKYEEYGKRPYQKLLIVTGFGLFSVLVYILMIFLILIKS